jgi:hypothetical protein
VTARRALPLVALLLTALLLMGCGVPRPAPAPVVPPGQVQALATQTRFDAAADRRFQITITNPGPLPYTVTSVRLESPGFAPAPASARDDPFPPGIRYDLPAAYGPARCDRQPEPATAVVGLHRDGGPTGTVRVPLPSADGLLARLHARECAAVELARQVQVGLVDLAPAGAGVLRGQLRVRRGSWAGDVTVTELRDSVLFAFSLALPVRLAPGATVLDVPVEVRPATCAAHRIADAKQPYLFPLFLSLGDGRAQGVDLPTTPDQQAAMYELTRTVCATGSR